MKTRFTEEQIIRILWDGRSIRNQDSGFVQNDLPLSLLSGFIFECLFL